MGPLLERTIFPYSPDNCQGILSSPHIKKFLEGISADRPIGFFDMDQNLWNVGVDVETLAFHQFGLIGRKPQWLKVIDAAKKTREESGITHTDSLVEDRELNLSYYANRVSQKLNEYTGIPKGKRMNPEVVYRLGNYIGNYVVDNHLYRDTAMEVLKVCKERGIQVVILSASPVELTQGVMDVVQSRLEMPEITALGTEDIYRKGKVAQNLFIYGDTKTAVVHEAIARGAIPFVGTGDKFLTSDKFIHECMIKGHVDKDALDGGESAWKRVLHEVRTRPIQRPQRLKFV